MIMKKTAIILIFMILLTCLCSCGGIDKQSLEDIAAQLEPPLRITATVKSDSVTAKMTMELYSLENDVTMRTTFTEPEMFKNLVVERKKDGKLIADYNGIETELDQNALKFIAVTHDIMQEVRNSLTEYGEPAASEDERYGKAVIEVNDGTITVYYDIETNKLLRVDSDLFDTNLKIDVLNIEKIE